jgi:hypothetical protein
MVVTVGWAQMNMGRQRRRRHLAKIADTAEHHDLRHRQPDAASDTLRVDVDGANDPPDRAYDLRRRTFGRPGSGGGRHRRALSPAVGFNRHDSFLLTSFDLKSFVL